MKTEIYINNNKLTTEIKSGIKVRDLITEIKNQIQSKPNTIFKLLDNNQKLLKEDDIISPDLKNKYFIKKLYLIEIESNLEKNKLNKMTNDDGDLLGNERIGKIIMKTTGAKSEVKSSPSNIRSRFTGSNLDDPFSRLMNVIQVLEENQIMFNNLGMRIGSERRNNGEANEDYVKQLQEMGFPEDRARQALINSRNNINRATEMLLGQAD